MKELALHYLKPAIVESQLTTDQYLAETYVSASKNPNYEKRVSALIHALKSISSFDDGRKCSLLKKSVEGYFHLSRTAS